MSQGILDKTKVYLCGPMQYQNGEAWRNDMTNFLDQIGVTVFDPYKKPFINAPEEDDNTHKKMKVLMDSGDYDEVAEHFKKVRSFDLSMVDRADFLICYINPKVFTAGSIEELSWGVRCKKPIFIVVEGGKKNTPLWIMGMLPHKYIYDSFDDVKSVLANINSGVKSIDSDRWRLLKDFLR